MRCFTFLCRTAVLLLLLAALLLTACADEPVSQGMLTADGLTFIVSTMTDEKTGEVSVTVSMTNGTADTLYLSAPERESADGVGTADYLRMTLDGAPSDRDGLKESGLTRWLNLDTRETHTETCRFTAELPAVLTVTVLRSPTYSGEYTETAITLPLRAE